MFSIQTYGCSTAAGDGVGALWNSLVEGKRNAKDLETTAWPVRPTEALKACRFSEPGESMRDRLASRLMIAYREAGPLPRREKIGVIFASAKGCLEDFIWDQSSPARETDPLTPCLLEFVDRAGLTPERSLCVSNACASSHAALFLASQWLKSGALSRVLVLAADGIGPFVLNGFHSLGALSKSEPKPFSPSRDGLVLGEAAAAMWIGIGGKDSLRLGGVGLDAEGYAVTRSSESGDSLKRAILEASGNERRRPGLIVAHATGTAANDRTEDRALTDLFGAPTPPITGTKWSIGHTLGASGLVDAIAAAECLKRGETFRIATTASIDETLGGNYLHAKSATKLQDLREALVTSVGFGGIHAAVRLGVDT